MALVWSLSLLFFLSLSPADIGPLTSFLAFHQPAVGSGHPLARSTACLLFPLKLLSFRTVFALEKLHRFYSTA